MRLSVIIVSGPVYWMGVVIQRRIGSLVVTYFAVFSRLQTALW